MDENALELELLSLETVTFELFVDTETAHGQITITVKPMEIIGNTDIAVDEAVTFTVNVNLEIGELFWSISDYEIAYLRDEYGYQVTLIGGSEGTAILTVENTYKGTPTSIQINVRP